MKLTQLRDLVAIVEHGSLRTAAKHLGIAQPLLTRSVQTLEKTLGVVLFERAARGMLLTDAGRVFHLRAAAVVNDLRRAQEELSVVEGAGLGTVTAGLSIMPHVGLLPHALPAFRARYPGVQLQLIEGLFPALEARLRGGSLDFYLGATPALPPAPGLVTTKLFGNVRAVVARRGHPLGGAASLRELVDADWATPSIDYNAGHDLRRLFARLRLREPKIALQAESALSLLVALAETDLLAMLPVQWADYAPTSNALQVVRVRERLPAPDIVLIRRAGLPLTSAAEHLVDLLLRSAPPEPPSARGTSARTRPAARRAPAKARGTAKASTG